MGYRIWGGGLWGCGATAYRGTIVKEWSLLGLVLNNRRFLLLLWFSLSLSFLSLSPISILFLFTSDDALLCDYPSSLFPASLSQHTALYICSFSLPPPISTSFFYSSFDLILFMLSARTALISYYFLIPIFSLYCNS